MSESIPADKLPRDTALEQRSSLTMQSVRITGALRTLAVVLGVTFAILMLQNFAIGKLFPNLARVSTDFSAAYLDRELKSLANSPPETIFLGDSVLWGFRIGAEDTAIALLRKGGFQCTNLAFKNSSPPNYYALVRLFERYGIRPKVVVVEINQKVFNQADASYQTLHPGVQRLAAPLLSASDRAALTLVPSDAGFAGYLEQSMTSLSLLYAMRSDIRETLYGDIDEAPAHAPSASQYEGTYDLSPLSSRNVGVEYLNKTLQLLHSARIPVLAFLTPTNHVLLHDYIDSAEYRANGAFLKRDIANEGAESIDLDAAFPESDFLDESHLTVHGQKMLASILRKRLYRMQSAAI